MSSHQKSSTAVTTILSAGLLAGLLDGAAASLMYYMSSGNSPARVFQYIASAIFGKKAFAGGSEMVVWGIVFHLCIALAFAGLFFLLYPGLQRFIKNKVIMGVLYGLLVWTVMNLVVVPLTQAPHATFQIKQAVLDMIVLVVMVGLPIALIVNHHYSSKRKMLRPIEQRR